MDAKLLQSLKELRTLKKNGDLDDEESLANQTILWRNRLEYNVLEGCLRHCEEEIRLAALGLLVESKKSTRCFAKVELDLIIVFLRYNLGERMEYVPLIKKALKRVKESLAVLRRRMAKGEKIGEPENRVDSTQESYEKFERETTRLAEESRQLVQVYRQFFQTFRRICVEGLCPGSTDSRKKSSLRMLRLGQELLEPEFQDSGWTIRQAQHLFDCLLLDTYEVNKEIMYEIAKGIEPHLFLLDRRERVREIIDVALDLANCIRPIDSITASYMLKISLLSPVIKDVLKSYPVPKNLLLETPEDATLRLIAIVLERLENPLKLARENIVAAAGKHSLYGYLFCIRNLLSIRDLGKIVESDREAWIRTIGEIIETSFGLNDAVSQIVNNSSPEGHLPMDLESRERRDSVCENGTSVVTPQMVLVCSWRTVKEVSLLFGYLSAKSPIVGEKDRAGLVNEKQLIDIGEHLVTLLFETKHRGAFEQAHVGFEQLCNRLWRLDQENLQKLPILWLHHLLLAISGLSSGNEKLCATRRSAGVPFMVQALVSSDPRVQSNPAEAVFHSVMKILLGLTNLEEPHETATRTKCLVYESKIFTELNRDADVENDEDRTKRNNASITEIKTHALNILRALFKHAQLGDLSKTYAADGLCAAIRSYDGKTWAERNAATLLFSALITRIFGVQRTKDHVNLTLHNKMTGRIFFERYPSLLEFTLNELGVFVESSDILIKPSVQSILLLLSRLYPSFNSDEADSKWRIDEFIKLVSACAKSRVYKTRELAARALVPLLTETSVQTFVLELFDIISLDRGRGSFFNAQHGYTLQILEITRSPRFSIEQLPGDRLRTFLARTSWIIENLEADDRRGTACFPLASVYVRVVAKLVIVDDTSRIEEFEKLFHRLVSQLVDARPLKRRPGREMYELAVAKLFLAVAEESSRGKIYCRSDLVRSTRAAWSTVLSHDNVQVRIVAWSGLYRVVEKTRDKKLLDTAVTLGLELATGRIIDPDLQDSVYDFLYQVLVNSDPTLRLDTPSLRTLCNFVVDAFVANSETIDNFQESPSFLRLLGKAYGTIARHCKDESSRMEDERMIYKIFLDNTWMGSADTGCRIAVSSVLGDLFVDCPDSSADRRSTLDWWTSLLNLLVDDNRQVRKNASRVVCEIQPITELQCIRGIVDSFFDKFFAFARQRPSLLFVALFAWSTSLSGDADYQMDESDVFNKCYNYEIFEPLGISGLCVKTLERLPIKDFSIDEELSVDLREWLNERLFDTTFAMKFSNIRQLVTEYGKMLSGVDWKLADLTDPTHNDKLLRAMAYEKIASMVFQRDASCA